MGCGFWLQRYRCASCYATFNALTGTPLARLRHKEKWLEYTQQLAEGQSVRNSTKACVGVGWGASQHYLSLAIPLPCAA